MAARRPTMRELRNARNSRRREEMELAITEGRLTVRQMTPAERRQADRDRARVARARAGREARRSARSACSSISRSY